MYESEINRQVESKDQIPPEVLARFGELEDVIVAHTVLPWSEHCTECVWPTCYTTCDLYSPREDLKCRRFIDGMVRIDGVDGLNSYLLKIRFKRWGKLWAVGNTRLYPLAKADAIKQRDRRIGTLLGILPLPSPMKRKFIQKRYVRKKNWAKTPNVSDELPSYFLLECFNPEEAIIKLSLTMRSEGEERNVPFQALIELEPGFNRAKILVPEISRVLTKFHY